MRCADFAEVAAGTSTLDGGDGPEKPLPYNRFFGAGQISACRVTAYRVRAPVLRPVAGHTTPRFRWHGGPCE